MRLRVKAQSARRPQQRAIVTANSAACPAPAEALPTTPALLRLTPTEAVRSSAGVSVEQLIRDLSHDVRQPLTSINMNLQCAIRMLQMPTPRLGAAVEALSDCLLSEHEILEMISRAQQRIGTLLQPEDAFPLNEIAHDVVLTLRASEPDLAAGVTEHLSDPSPAVGGTSWRLRMSLLALVRRVLTIEEFETPTNLPLVLETRATDSRGELLLKNIKLALIAGQLLRPLLDEVASSARRLGGSTSLDVAGQHANLHVFLPLAARFTGNREGGDYGT